MLENFIDGTELEARESLLTTENAALRDRLLRALAEVENTRRQAERTASDARQFAVLELAREMLSVADNLQRAIAAAECQQYRLAEDASLIEGCVPPSGCLRALSNVSASERFLLLRLSSTPICMKR